MSTSHCGDKINFNYSHVKLDFLGALGDWESLKGFTLLLWSFFSSKLQARWRDLQLVASQFQHSLCRQSYEINKSLSTDAFSLVPAHTDLIRMITGCSSHFPQPDDLTRCLGPLYGCFSATFSAMEHWSIKMLIIDLIIFRWHHIGELFSYCIWAISNRLAWIPSSANTATIQACVMISSGMHKDTPHIKTIQ